MTSKKEAVIHRLQDIDLEYDVRELTDGSTLSWEIAGYSYTLAFDLDGETLYAQFEDSHTGKRGCLERGPSDSSQIAGLIATSRPWYQPIESEKDLKEVVDYYVKTLEESLEVRLFD